MGHNAGQVGNDMTAVSIAAGLQATKVGQLTQAWDAYMQLLTGGTNALATFEQGLANMGTVAASSAGRQFEAQGKINSSTSSSPPRCSLSPGRVRRTGRTSTR